MNARTSARQYANALFDVASRNGRTEEIRRDLARFAALVASHAELGRVAADPAVPSSAKAAIVRALLDRMGGVADEVRRLLTWLADRDRLVLVADVDALFSARVLDAARIVNAEVTTPTGLDEGARAALQQALSKALGRDVVMTERVDSSIVGGLIAKAGSIVFDGSVTRQIDRVREQLLGSR
ncbi:MAG: ATP synthase F1 subunit delta [Acidobacteria bacterium]|nr:ATP synthase F1 subunit delta [Acidobacteriota bacterium]